MPARDAAAAAASRLLLAACAGWSVQQEQGRGIPSLFHISDRAPRPAGRPTSIRGKGLEYT